jgi:hypothetical protein
MKMLSLNLHAIAAIMLLFASVPCLGSPQWRLFGRCVIAPLVGPWNTCPIIMGHYEYAIKRAQDLYRLSPEPDSEMKSRALRHCIYGGRVYLQFQNRGDDWAGRLARTPLRLDVTERGYEMNNRNINTGMWIVKTLESGDSASQKYAEVDRKCKAEADKGGVLYCVDRKGDAFFCPERPTPPQEFD